MIQGILFTFIISFLGLMIAKLPLMSYLGSMVIAILLAIFYRQIFGYPEKWRTGIQFSSKKILRFAIILFGLKLNIQIILHQGLSLLAKGAITIVLAIVITTLIAKLIKADLNLSFLLGVGTGVCGAAAIAAVSPIIKAKEEDTAIGVGIIALMGTIFTVVYTIIYPILHLTAKQYGVWCGISLHEIAHVVAATSPAGQDALAIGLLSKLGRVFLLIPLSFIIVIWLKISKKHESSSKIEFPWFLIGFIIMAVVGTYIHIPTNVSNLISTDTSFLLTSAMVGLGLNVDFKILFQKSPKPLISMLIASIAISIVSFFLV